MRKRFLTRRDERVVTRCDRVPGLRWCHLVLSGCHCVVVRSHGFVLDVVRAGAAGPRASADDEATKADAVAASGGSSKPLLARVGTSTEAASAPGRGCRR